MFGRFGTHCRVTSRHNNDAGRVRTGRASSAARKPGSARAAAVAAAAPPCPSSTYGAFGVFGAVPPAKIGVLHASTLNAVRKSPGAS